MTLAEVADLLDRRMRSVLSVDPKDLEYTAGIRYALAEFQKDPEFKLPERVETWIEEQLGDMKDYPGDFSVHVGKDAFRRLREIREGK